MSKNVTNIILLTLLAFSLNSCSGVTTRLYTSPGVMMRSSVCILQPESLCKDKDAGIKVREQLATELLLYNLFPSVVDLGLTDDAIRKLKIRGTTDLGKETLKALGEELNVDSIIFGSVVEFGRDSKEREGRVEVSVNLTMVDADSGETIWKGHSSKVAKVTLSEIFGLTAGPTPLEISREVVKDFVTSLRSGFNTADEEEIVVYRPQRSPQKTEGKQPQGDQNGTTEGTEGAEEGVEEVEGTEGAQGNDGSETEYIPTMVPRRIRRR
ncbi:MAG: GNA1162 family protein [bacterium]